MCGRYSLGEFEDNQIRIRFKASWYDKLAKWQASFNVAPGQDAPVVYWDAKKNERKVMLMHWGLVPFWAKDIKIGYKMINARAETIREKPSYKKSFEQRRCIIPADAFYEWQKVGKEKHPMRIVPKKGEYLALAGLFDTWKKPDGKPLSSFTIITTDHNDFMKPVHDRMPALLVSEEIEEAWLSPETMPDEAYKLLSPAQENFLKMYEVSTLVNSPKNNGPELAEPIEKAG